MASRPPTPGTVRPTIQFPAELWTALHQEHLNDQAKAGREQRFNHWLFALLTDALSARKEGTP